MSSAAIPAIRPPEASDLISDNNDTVKEEKMMLPIVRHSVIESLQQADVNAISEASKAKIAQKFNEIRKEMEIFKNIKDNIENQKILAIQEAKHAVRKMMEAIDADPMALPEFTTDNDSYHWRGMRPFYEMDGAEKVATEFWSKLHASMSAFQRREDIFIAGYNQHSPDDIWTLSHGYFMGMFDGDDFAGISACNKTVLLPYAEFHRVLEDGRIAESALYLDLVRLQQQCGLDPFPTQTGSRVLPPGPRTGDGILLDAHDPAEGEKTRILLDTMVDDCSKQNERGSVSCPVEVLERTWESNMAWYGPGGIGSVHTIPRYQEQHQTPFRTKLSDKVFNGHVCRIAEGNYSGWFGWPNLNNRNTGGFLGLPCTGDLAEMRVVDIYRRDGDKLAENWVFIDVLHYASQHGIDLLKDPCALHKSEESSDEE